MRCAHKRVRESAGFMEQLAGFVGIGVGGLAVDYFQEGRCFVLGGGGGGEDVADLPALEDQGVGDEGAMAAPGDGFGAHDGGGSRAGDLREGVEAFGELRGCHVVGVSAEGGVAPAGVDGVLAAVAAAAKGFQVGVVDIGGTQRGCERVGIELRHMARFGNGADVDEMADGVRFQKLNKLFDGVRGVADGEEGSIRHRLMVIQRQIGSPLSIPGGKAWR